MEMYWSGERLETFVYNENMVEHLHRYSLAMSYAQDKIVLDIACGEGYGSNHLAGVAKFVYGVDISADTIVAARSKYRANNLSFLEGAADAIPLETASVDVVVSFETIEHHYRHEEMLLEIKRVLKPEGILIMSSPDKKYYTDETGYVNKFHVKELYAAQFRELIGRHFKKRFFLNQRFLAGSVMIAEGNSQPVEIHQGSYDKLETITPFTPVYNLVVAADVPFDPPASSIFRADQWISMLSAQMESRFKASATWKVGRLIIGPVNMLKQMFNRT
jgi:ubiquinone/menaquinone biosynthesis C-methylase UbiE